MFKLFCYWLASVLVIAVCWGALYAFVLVPVLGIPHGAVSMTLGVLSGMLVGSIGGSLSFVYWAEKLGL